MSDSRSATCPRPAGHAVIRNHRNGTVTVSGLSPDDLRLLGRAAAEGAFTAGDRGGPLSHAIARLADALRVPASFPTLHAPVVLTRGHDDPALNFVEVVS